MPKDLWHDVESDIYNGLMKKIKSSNNITQHFDRDNIIMSDKQRKSLKVMCNPTFRWKYYDYMETYHPIIDDNGTKRGEDDKEIDHAACAPFATTAAHAFCNADGMTLPLSVPWSTWELAERFSTISNNYRVESCNRFDKNYLENLPDGSIITAQYDASRYKSKWATHSLIKVNGWLAHLFHEDMVFSSWSDILPYKNQQGHIISNKFILNTGIKNDGKKRYESFTLVPWSSIISPIYNNNKDKIKPRYEYTVQTTTPISARRLAELIWRSLTIPQAAAAAMIRDQNSTLFSDKKWLASVSDQRKVKIIWWSSYKIDDKLKIEAWDQIVYEPQ